MLAILMIAFPGGPVLAAPDASQPTGAETTKTPEPLFRVTLLGTGNPRPSIDRFGPAILVEAGDTKLLFDCGRGATQRLFQLDGAPLLRSIDAVFLTHLHSDHVVGLPDLWLTGWLFGRHWPLSLYGPKGTAELATHLTAAFAFDVKMRQQDEGLAPNGARLKAKDGLPGVLFQKDGLGVVAFAVDHGPVRPAFGYRIDFAGHSVVLSGDTRATSAVAAAARGADLLVHEVISPDAERRLAAIDDPKAIETILARHATPEDCGRLFAKARPRLAVYSHIVPSPATDEDLIPPTRKFYDGPLEVGHDLMAITIGEKVVVTTREGLQR
ncbi:MAG TPA: MBL fold metallo-hydrolase [Verrucomicrobiae bacterium]|nr:MBL fold metallo-hydrolase [Verrucomicrobiae bacterium]